MISADLVPQVASDGIRAMQRAIAEPEEYAIEPKVDGARGLICFREDRVIEARNRRGTSRDWFRHEPFRVIRALASRLPFLWRGTVLDGELTAGPVLPDDGRLEGIVLAGSRATAAARVPDGPGSRTVAGTNARPAI